MKRLTQTRSDNCWQTSVAMLLDCEPGVLPDQSAIAGRAAYARALRAYLFKHHNASYGEAGPEKFAAIASQRIFHLMLGETERTSRENDVGHVIVGFGGEPYWDVHSSRAGLKTVEAFGVLFPFPEIWRADWEAKIARGDEEVRCVCSACDQSSKSRAA